MFDVVEAGARLYLVMESLRGETLAARLLRGPLPLRETVDLGRQMADALGHAHSHGLLHCDFKPANVMLTPGNHVKVLDFGLARTFQGPDSEALGASASLIRNRAGTPAYMAPEHRLGLPLGPPADVFALGIVLHEMCTGQRPAHGPACAHRIPRRGRRARGCIRPYLAPCRRSSRGRFTPNRRRASATAPSRGRV